MGGAKTKLRPYSEEAFKLLRECETQIAESGKPKPDSYANLQCSLESISRVLNEHLRQSEWTKGASESLRFELESGQKEQLPERAQLQIIEEEFIALRYVFFMRYVFRHPRNLLQFVVLGFIFSVLSLESYPFEGQRWINFVFILSLLVFGTGVGLVFAQNGRDAILSR